MMRCVFLALLAALVLWGVCSCTRRVYVPVESVRTIERRVIDTVVLTRLERESIRAETRDTLSYLETRYAASTASVSGGLLRHALETKADSLPVRVLLVETHTTDSIPAPYPVYIDKHVEKPTRMPLRWWERTLIGCGIAAIALLAMRLARVLRR